MEYLTQKRIEKAKELLITSDLRLAEIAVQVGYRDVSYFTRIFKKQIGITAKIYRETARYLIDRT